MHPYLSALCAHISHQPRRQCHHSRICVFPWVHWWFSRLFLFLCLARLLVIAEKIIIVTVTTTGKVTFAEHAAKLELIAAASISFTGVVAIAFQIYGVALFGFSLFLLFFLDLNPPPPPYFLLFLLFLNSRWCPIEMFSEFINTLPSQFPFSFNYFIFLSEMCSISNDKFKFLYFIIFSFLFNSKMNSVLLDLLTISLIVSKTKNSNKIIWLLFHLVY